MNNRNAQVIEERAAPLSGPWARYSATRQRTERICAPLAIEDHCIQPVVDVSPPKWHLGHTTWFFEEFLLKKRAWYKVSSNTSYLFNSYYESLGARVQRDMRGQYSRPTVKEVLDHRHDVDKAMDRLLREGISEDELAIFELGLNHEEQHQELLITDIKTILCQEPLFPAYGTFTEGWAQDSKGPIEIEGGIYSIGHHGQGFHFDHERERHDVLVRPFKINSGYVTNGQWLDFMADGGYSDHRLWHQEGWQWVNDMRVKSPLYWYEREGGWHWFSLQGLKPLDHTMPVAHISFYEAHAFANWCDDRLPTEQELEIASPLLEQEQRWEWTQSAFLPYPGYKPPQGAIGEYNGKFMVGQMVLRGASVATPKGHSRSTYRNFFHPHLRWQYTGLRLVQV
ncbi:MAG: ergothioneine biosynthesis protein EgtB [Bacteroidota bacterium]|nr:ergothioneine biosynthesis protein EgtB [Bacteroidota bacterium]